MIRRTTFKAALAALALAGLLVSAVQAAPKQLKINREWRGSVEDPNLQREAPRGGVITSQEALEKLWKAWKVGEKAPKVDFSKELVLVATSRGSRLNLRPQLSDQGDLRVGAVATRDLRPGFRYHIGTVSRDGVKSVNGRPLARD